MVAHTSSRAARPHRFGTRMLAAVALSGAAALLVACSAGDPGASQEPSAPPAAATGAAPVPLDDALLQGVDLFDGLNEQAILVRWVEPGELIAVVVGGSGSGGECIPQPHAAALEAGEPAITVRFDPPNPDVVCTMDFRLHGWELALPEPVDASGSVPVQLVNTSGAEETIEVELGPDDILTAAPTADPQPSAVPGQSVDTEPVAIPAAQLPDVMSVIDPQQDPAVAVRWLEPGASLAVLLGGSGAEQCVPQPIGATSTGPGAVEVAFEHPSGDMDCSADLRLYGWELPLPEAISATLPIQVTVTGAAADGATAEITVEPDDILELR